MSSFTLCRVCAYFKPGENTCSRSVTVLRGGEMRYTLAKLVRLDSEQCGLEAWWFKEMPKGDPRRAVSDNIQLQELP
jgi:hypothetical protein